jgi:hypothetical protein
VSPEVVAQLTKSAQLIVGLSATPDQMVDWPENGSSLSWDIPLSDCGQAVQWLDAAGKQPSHWLGGPAEVRIDFNKLRFLEAGRRDELPYQGRDYYLDQAYDGYGTFLGESGCRLRLMTNKSSLSMVLFLPFEQPDEALWAYASHLQSHLPIAFSQKHWAHWKLTKKADSYRRVRIKSVPLFQSSVSPVQSRTGGDA